ncbi:MAG: hypothetical protein GC185_06680 [Alphaproteobacteria bacterium]|nr:hypothetical protein [Alphaproteobacteria bacterium]
MKNSQEIALAEVVQDGYDTVAILSGEPSEEWLGAFDGNTSRLCWRHVFRAGSKVKIRACSIEEFREDHLPALEKAVAETNATFLAREKKVL